MNNSKIYEFFAKNTSLNHDIDLTQYPFQYGKDGEGKLIIKCSDIDLGSSEFNIENVLSKVQSVVHNGETLPIFFTETLDELILEHPDGTVEIQFDLLKCYFLLVSGIQEPINKKRDKIGRFPYQESIQKKLQITDKPIADYYTLIFLEALSKAYKLDLSRLKKTKTGFTTFVSHDIDLCYSGWKQGGLSELKNGRPFNTLKLIFQRFFNRDTWFNFSEILALNKKLGVQSAAFFFLTRKGANKEFNLDNGDYDITNSVFKNVLDEILEQGSEIGIQGSLGAGFRQGVLEEDITTLDKNVSGNRCHFLFYELKKLPGLLEKAGLRYDNSPGFAEAIGFRHSSCKPFYFFDFENEKTSEIICLPLIIMDRTLSQKKYMNVPKESAAAVCEPIISEIEKHGGVLSLLWHNHHFSEYKFTGWREVYEEIIGVCTRKGSQFHSGARIIEKLKPNN